MSAEPMRNIKYMCRILDCPTATNYKLHKNRSLIALKDNVQLFIINLKTRKVIFNDNRVMSFTQCRHSLIGVKQQQFSHCIERLYFTLFLLNME